MSTQARKVAEAAKENPELLGSTNVGTREHQSPATASKVERAQVQANAQPAVDVVGNTSNRPARAIPSEFRGDTDATKDRIEALGDEVPEVPNPQNRFAPNNVGADAAVEGQSVDTSGEFPVGISTEEAKVQNLEVHDNVVDANNNLADRPEFGDTKVSDEPGAHRVEDRSDKEEDAGSLNTTVPAEEPAKVDGPSDAFLNAEESDTPERDEAKTNKNQVKVSDVQVGPTGAVDDEFPEKEEDETTPTISGGEATSEPTSESTSTNDNKETEDKE